jgi:acetyl-CoA C-acetyltransferase
MPDLLIAAAARTPLGSFQGKLASLPAPRLGAAAIRGALERSGLAPEAISEVIMGNVLSAGSGQAPTRQAALYAGLPHSVRCMTVNKVCGSGLKSVILGCHSLLLGESEWVIAGGMESMSQAPYLLPKAREGYRMGHQTVIDSMIQDGLWDPYNGLHMGACAEQCATKYQFSREEQDAYAQQSYERAQQMQQSGAYAREIVAVDVPGRKGAMEKVDTDENPSRADFAKMAALKPAFDKQGTITAANASTINDGAAALVLARGETVKDQGIRPLARVAAWAEHSQDPVWFTTAPVEAMRKALAKANWTADSVDLFEVNEAFAIVPMVIERELKVPREKLNTRGGAVSLGHPIGASGARILVSLAYAMAETGARRGLASICIGGGEALAVALEAVD